MHRGDRIAAQLVRTFVRANASLDDETGKEVPEAVYLIAARSGFGQCSYETWAEALLSCEPACSSVSYELDEARFRKRDRRPALPVGGGHGGRP